MNSEIMTVNELSKYLKLNKQTVYRKVTTGEIPTVKIGRILRFKKEIIDEWLRLASFGWNIEKRKKLYIWAENWAKKQGLKERDVLNTISKRRHSR